MVTHLLGCPGQLSAFSNSSMAPLVFFSFFTSASTAFSAHFSSSSPCFQPNSFLTAGLVNENKLFIDEMVEDERPESNSSTSIARIFIIYADNNKRNDYNALIIYTRVMKMHCTRRVFWYLIIFFKFVLIYCYYCCLAV